MATWAEVRRLATSLPEVEERPGQWRVGGRMFAWERPLRKVDLEALGAGAPEGPILAVRVPDLAAKEALLADDSLPAFTTPHFDGYPAVLVELEKVDDDVLAELVVEAWLDRAPRRLARAWLDAQP